MSMTMNQERFQNQLQALADALKVDGRLLLKDESRLFLKQAINFIPPKNKEQGERAIGKELNRTFTAVNWGFLTDIQFNYGNSNIQQWLTNKDGQRYELRWDEIVITPQRIQRLHMENRFKRFSRTNRGSKQGSQWFAKYVTSYEMLADYKSKIKSHVGMMKSGFLKAYQAVGGKLPSWVERHVSRSLGGVENKLDDATSPSITISNHAPGIKDFERIIEGAFRARAQAIAKRIKLLMSGYAGDIRSKRRVGSKMVQLSTAD